MANKIIIDGSRSVALDGSGSHTHLPASEAAVEAAAVEERAAPVASAWQGRVDAGAQLEVRARVVEVPVRRLWKGMAEGCATTWQKVVEGSGRQWKVVEGHGRPWHGSSRYHSVWHGPRQITRELSERGGGGSG